MHQIIVIGTVPPCPRCRLLTEIVTSKVKELGLNAEARHLSFQSEEASQLAGKAGLTPGTAKDVSRILGRDINIENMPKAANEAELDFVQNLQLDLKLLESLFREVNILDHWLRPFENAARDTGILMTPVLIIDDTIKHSGSVPAMASIDEWLSALK